MSSQQYYDDVAKHGEYQYVLLKDIVNNFMLMNVGDDKIINDVQRYQVVHHAKRALQELNYSALKEESFLEVELSETLRVTMPQDFVQLTKVSWVDDSGRLHPMTQNKYMSQGAKGYLQDENGNFIFNEAGELQEADSLADQRSYVSRQDSIDYDALEAEHTGGRFGMDTASANKNGTYIVEKKSGYIRFSSHLQDGDLVVIQYISDGMSVNDDSILRVHKLAEDYIYSYIQAQVLDRKYGVQEYVVRRSKKDASAKLRNAKIRLMNINLDDLVQNLKGRNKWIK